MQHQRPLAELPLVSPPQERGRHLQTTPRAAVADLQARYAAATGFLRDAASRAVMAGAAAGGALPRLLSVGRA